MSSIIQSSPGLTFEITKLWNGDPIPPSPFYKNNTHITLEGVANVLTISILASFYGDPTPPKIPSPDQSYPNLWPYEIVEIFFFSTETQRYLQVVLSPHGQYLVLLSNGTKNHIDSGLTIQYNASIDLESGTWRGSAKIPVDYLPSKVDRFMAASKHGYGQQRVVETLYPVEGKPGDKIDLHQPQKFGEINLESILPGFQQRSDLSGVWQKSLANPISTHTIFYMWNGSLIEDDHPDHHSQFCTVFLKGVSEGLSLDVLCPFFEDPSPSGQPGPSKELSNFEHFGAYFLASSTTNNTSNRYIEVLLGPFGQHSVRLLDGVNNPIMEDLPLQFASIIDGVSNAWVGNAIIPADYFPPGVNKMILTAVHNTGKQPEDVKYEVSSPMPGLNPDFHRLENYMDVQFETFLPGNVGQMSARWDEALQVEDVQPPQNY